MGTGPAPPATESLSSFSPRDGAPDERWKIEEDSPELSIVLC